MVAYRNSSRFAWNDVYRVDVNHPLRIIHQGTWIPHGGFDFPQHQLPSIYNQRDNFQGKCFRVGVYEVNIKTTIKLSVIERIIFRDVCLRNLLIWLWVKPATENKSMEWHIKCGKLFPRICIFGINTQLFFSSSKH